MKIKLTFLTVLITYAASAQQGWIDRKDINPALIYWKEFLVMAGNPNNDEVEPNHDKPAIDSEYEKVVQAYDEHFRRLAKARQMTVPCDWGGDNTEGPSLLLPHLEHAKRTSQIARLRVRYYLEKGRPDKAVEDLLTAFTLARHVGQELYLINVLVEIAMNGILLDAIAESFHLFPDDTLKQLESGLKRLPKGGSVASTIRMERNFMAGWMEKEIKDVLESVGGDEVKALPILEEKVKTFGGAHWDDFMEKSNGDINGLLKLLRVIYPYYDEAHRLFALPPQESLDAVETFMKKVEKSDNPFGNLFFPALRKSRLKELGNRVRMAMLDAAIAYKLDSKTGLERVADPFSSSPFKMTRVLYKGKDRGFVLTSKFKDPVMNRQAFVETPGERFGLWGKTVGKTGEVLKAEGK